MKVQCVILVVCAAICASAAPVVQYCRCVKTVPMVNPQKISKVDIILPTFHCNRKEIFITLKGGKGMVCLDPEGLFSKRLEQGIAKQTAKNKSTQTSTQAAPLSTFTGFIKTLQTSSTFTSATSK